jgi:hypothetical protein
MATGYLFDYSAYGNPRGFSKQGDVIPFWKYRTYAQQNCTLYLVKYHMQFQIY